LAAQFSNFTDVNYDNQAWDAKLNYTFGGNACVPGLGVGAGYKSIGRNFAAAGAWDKIGRWTDPTDVQGPYADVIYPYASNLKFRADGEWLQAKDDYAPTPIDPVLVKGDIVAKAEGGVNWGFTKNNSLDVSYEWIKYDPNSPGVFESTESYLTIGVGHQMNPNAGVKIAYQFIGLNAPADTRPYYTADSGGYRGGLGVVQFGANF